MRVKGHDVKLIMSVILLNTVKVVNGQISNIYKNLELKGLCTAILYYKH